MIPRFNQFEADKIVKKLLFVNRDMLPIYQAGATDLFISFFCYFNNEMFNMLFTAAYSDSVGLSDLVNNHDNNIAQIISLLNNKCDESTKVDGCTKWRFNDYGFSIQEPQLSKNATNAKLHKGLWLFEYYQSVSYFIKITGVISGNDIERIFIKLENNPNALVVKPDSIVELENLMGVQAVRHSKFFGRWQLNIPGFASIVCNPFQLDCGQSNSADDFDTLYYANDTIEGFETVDTIKNKYHLHRLRTKMLLLNSLGTGKTTASIQLTDTIMGLMRDLGKD